MPQTFGPPLLLELERRCREELIGLLRQMERGKNGEHNCRKIAVTLMDLQNAPERSSPVACPDHPG